MSYNRNPSGLNQPPNQPLGASRGPTPTNIPGASGIGASGLGTNVSGLSGVAGMSGMTGVTGLVGQPGVNNLSISGAATSFGRGTANISRDVNRDFEGEAYEVVGDYGAQLRWSVLRKDFCKLSIRTRSRYQWIR